jgi:hypothetical protein
MSNKLPRYIIYDGRYKFDPDRALVMDMENDIEEARRMSKEYGADCVIVDTQTGEAVQ